MRIVKFLVLLLTTILILITIACSSNTQAQQNTNSITPPDVVVPLPTSTLAPIPSITTLVPIPSITYDTPPPTIPPLETVPPMPTIPTISLVPMATPTPSSALLGSISGKVIISPGETSILYLFKGDNFSEKGVYSIDETYADAEGNYSFTNLEPGMYTIFGITMQDNSSQQITGINPNWPHVTVIVIAGRTQVAHSFSP